MMTIDTAYEFWRTPLAMVISFASADYLVVIGPLT